MYVVDLEYLTNLRLDVKKYKDLPPCEKLAVLNEIADLARDFRSIIGDDLTEKVLYATLCLTNSLDASGELVPPLLDRQRPNR